RDGADGDNGHATHHADNTRPQSGRYSNRYASTTTRPNSRSRVSWLVGALLLATGACYAMGSFDVFLASNHFARPAHPCFQYGHAPHVEWYCNGPWSTKPFTPEVQAAFNAWAMSVPGTTPPGR